MEFLWLLALIILLAYTIEAVTGFGSIVIALSLGAWVLPVPLLLPVLVPLNILMTGWLSWQLRRQIDFGLLTRRILPLMALGTLVGYLLLPWLNEYWLKPLFALLIIWFAGRELWRMVHAAAVTHPSWLTSPLMFSAGITHGLFASGGPLLVYSLAGTALDKTRFRATLISVWFLLNSALTVAFFLDGRLLPMLPQVAMLACLLPLGIWLGEHIHHRVDEHRFRQLVYIMLLVSGLALLLSSAHAML
jgi:uncharacterized protein